VEHLGDPAGILVVDETGFLKQGTTSVGVQRQYSGTAGKVDNCQLGVFLAYASTKGRAFIDRELYLPHCWTDDPDRCRAARVPVEVGFRTKPQLARVMLERALDARVPASWVTADEVYGGDPALRRWLEGRGVSYVLAVKCTEPLAVAASQAPVRATAEQLATGVAAERWVTASAGQGAKGRRLYDWTRVELTPPAAGGMARWLLMRRRRSDGELASYAGYAPATTSLLGLVRVVGTRWVVEEGFEQAKGRGRPGPLRGPPLAGLVPAHHPGAARPCLHGRHPRPGHQLRAGKGGRGGLTGGLGLVPLTVPEVRCLLVVLVWMAPSSPGVCWPGPGGVAAIRPAPAARITGDTSSTRRERASRPLRRPAKCWAIG
jgi:DDE superfamily endonuclease